MRVLDEIIKSEEDYSIIKVFVTPNAKKDEIIGLDKWRGSLNIKIKEKPLHGSANKAVIKFIADIFSLKSGDVEIIRGEKSREKTLRLRIKKSMAIDLLKHQAFFVKD